jgi:hypothetical protein
VPIPRLILVLDVFGFAGPPLFGSGSLGGTVALTSAI